MNWSPFLIIGNGPIKSIPHFSKGFIGGMGCKGPLIVFKPHFERVWRWHSHSRNGNLGVLRDSQKLRARLQGSKHLALKCSLYRWKGLEAKMLKMALHEPFGHLQHKLCTKEGPDSRPLKVANRPNPGVFRWSVTHPWKTLKERYKFASDLILIGDLSKELWAAKVLGIWTRTVSGLLLGSPGKKCHSDVGEAE
jgi:hypothetical protein